MAISQITSESIAANTVVVADLGPITYLNSGAGNSFYIQANNTTGLIIDTNQRVGIGFTDPQANLIAKLQISDGNTTSANLITSDPVIITAQNTAPGFTIVSAGSTQSQRGVFKAVRSRGSLIAPQVPILDDNVFSLLGAIYDGSITRATAGINMDVDGTVSSGVAPQRLTFLTGNTSSRIEAMRIDSNQRVGIGTTSPVSKLDVYGASGYVDIRARSGSNQTYIGADASASYIGTYSNIPLLLSTNNSEKMRIDANGNIGIAGTSVTGYSILSSKAVTGSISSYGFVQQGTIASDVTSYAAVWVSATGTAASSFTLTNLRHYQAQQGTFGAGSTVTTQHGYVAETNLTGATNNYGFNSAIASGNGRYNFYASGTADNYFAGALGIGQTSLTGWGLRVAKTVTGATGAGQIAVEGVIASDVTSTVRQFSSYAQTGVASFTLNSLNHYAALQGTFGAGSTVTSQYGFHAESNLTGATTNIGFYSNISSGTGRYNFYAAGTADNYFNGNIYSRNLLLQGDSTNAYVRTTNAGNLYLGANNNNILSITSSGYVNYYATDMSNQMYIQNLNSTSSSRYPGLVIQNYTGSSLSTGFSVIELETSRGSSASPLSVVSGQLLGGFNTWGHNGSGWQSATRIQGYAADTFSTAVSAGLQFLTTLSGTQTEALRIDEYGRVGVGTTSPAKKLDVNGSVGFDSYVNKNYFVAGSNGVTDAMQWIKLGRISGASNNGGISVTIRIHGGYGFNADPAQAGYDEIVIRGSNGNSAGGRNVGGRYYRVGTGSAILGGVKLKSVNSISYDSDYDLYVYSHGGLCRNLSFEVVTDIYGLFTWSIAGSQTDPGTQSSTVAVLNNDYGIYASTFSVQSITFPSTQVSSANANTLDDYEEGTWTPNISGNNGTGSFTVKIGSYVKIGRQVTCWFVCDGGSSNAGGSTQYVSGLPFTIGSIQNNTNLGTMGTNGPALRSQQLFTLSANRGIVYIYNGGSQETTAITFGTGSFTYWID